MSDGGPDNRSVRDGGTLGRQTGTVLIVDSEPWDCLFQLAAGVRRSGLRAVRVTTSVPRRIETVGKLAFDRTIVLQDQAELSRLPYLLRAERLVDVQCMDTMLGDVVANLAPLSAHLPYAVWAARARATDKWEVARVLRDHGILVPETLLLAETTPDEAAERLGFPLVVKPKVASGGAGVIVVDSREHLDDVLRGPTDDRYYEQFVDGDALQYGAVVGDDGVLASATFATHRRIFANGPSSLVSSVDDRQLDEIGDAVIHLLGLRGFVNIQVIRDADGRSWLHDLNPRVWGCFLAFRAMGVDFLELYLQWLANSDSPNRRARTTAGTSAEIFPLALEHVIAGRGLDRYGRGVRWAAPYIRQLGWRYLAVELVKKRGLLGKSEGPVLPRSLPRGRRHQAGVGGQRRDGQSGPADDRGAVRGCT